MPTSLETLKTRKDSIREELNLLKNLTQSQEKAQKKEKIASEISELDQELQTYLAQESDAAKKTEAQALANELVVFSSALKDLEQEVINSQKSESGPETTELSSPAKAAPATEEKKNFLQKGMDWIKGDENETHHTAKAIGRGALVASGIGIGVYGLGKLFGRWGKEKEKSESDSDISEKKEEKGFRSSGFGKFLKWTGIGAGVGTVGYYLGKWFGWWGNEKPGEGADATDNAKDQAENTAELKEKNPEKFAKYQGMGANIDNQYHQIMKKELDAGWSGMSIADGYVKYADKTKLSKEDFQATVPMCIDNEFSSVENLLSEGGYYGYLREKSLGEIKSFLIGKGKEWIGKIMGPYLVNLTSFIPFIGDDWSESLTKWLESGEPAEREAELKLFFRQYAKVVNYTQNIRARLIEKIAEEKFKNVGEDFSTLEDALDDEERLTTHIYSDARYKNFMGGKLHQAIDVMKSQSLFDAQLSVRMKKQMEAADAQRDTILKAKDGKDALQRLQEANGNLTPELNREGIQVCKDITEDLKENFDKDWSYLYFGSAHAAINSDQKNIQEFLKESGLGDLKSGILDSLKHFEQKFASGQMTPADLELYKNQINSYFAMKKEILIGAESIQQMKADNANWGERALNIGSAAVGDILHHTGQTLKSFKDGNFMTGWLQATLPLVIGGAIVTGVGKYTGNKAVENIGRFIHNSNLFSLARNIKGKVIRRMPNKNLNFMPNWLLSSRYNISHGDQLLFQDIIEGKINGEKAQRLIKKGNSQWKHGEGINSLSEFIQKVAGKTDTELPAKQLQILFNNDAQISFTKNKSLRDLFFRQGKIGAWEQTKSIWNGYRQKIYTPSGFHHVEILEKFMAGEAGQTSPFAKLTKNQQLLFKELVDQGKFTKIEELDAILKNIDNINLENVEIGKISRLASELGASLDDFLDPAKLQNKITASLQKPLDQTVIVDDAVDSASEALRKKPIFNDLGEQKKLLNAELERLQQLSSKSSVDQARINKLQTQLTELENFEKQLMNGGEEMVDQTSELLTLLKKGGNLSSAIEQLELLKKLEGEKFVSSVIDPKTGKGIERSLDEVIKNLDDAAIRSLKGKISGVSDDALENLAKTFADIKVAQNAKKFFSNADELLTGVKTMIKIFAKVT